jgi:hypothetical protein
VPSRSFIFFINVDDIVPLVADFETTFNSFLIMTKNDVENPAGVVTKEDDGTRSRKERPTGSMHVGDVGECLSEVYTGKGFGCLNVK